MARHAQGGAGRGPPPASTGRKGRPGMAKGRSPQADGDGGKRKQLRKRLRKAEDQLTDAQQKRDRAQARVEALAIIADEVRAQLPTPTRPPSSGLRPRPARPSLLPVVQELRPGSSPPAAPEPTARPQLAPPRPSPAAGPRGLSPPAPPRTERRLRSSSATDARRSPAPGRACHGQRTHYLRPSSVPGVTAKGDDARRRGRQEEVRRERARRGAGHASSRDGNAGGGALVFLTSFPPWAGHAYPICAIATPRARRNGRPVIRRQSGRKLRRKRSTSASRESR